MQSIRSASSRLLETRAGDPHIALAGRHTQRIRICKKGERILSAHSEGNSGLGHRESILVSSEEFNKYHNGGLCSRQREPYPLASNHSAKKFELAHCRCISQA